MINDWPTEEQDLDIAADIINRHVALNGGRPLEMVRIMVDKDEQSSVDIEMSDWVNELIATFRLRYGYEQAHAIISNILTKLYLQNEIVH